MKKILIIFLVIDMILLLSYCTIRNQQSDSPAKSEGITTTQVPVSSTAVQAGTIPQVTQGKETTVVTTPQEPKKDYFESYESILELCRIATDYFDYEYDYEVAVKKADSMFGLEDSTEKEWFMSIYYVLGYYLAPNHNEPNNKRILGYAVKDLNGDGIDELVLLNDSYKVGAVFSMVKEKPVLLGTYRDRSAAWIDEQGLIHNDGSSGAAYSSTTVYRIAEGGASLELVVEYGTDGIEWVGEDYVVLYYKLVNGEKVRITQEECWALADQYHNHIGTAATKEKAGLVFKPLFADDAAAAFERVLDLKIPVYDTRKNSYVFLDKVQFLNEVNYFSYTVMDFDGDSVNEFLISSSKIFLLRYYQGEVYLYSFEQSEMDTLFTDGTALGHIGVDSKHARGYRISFEGAQLKKQVVADAELDLETQEYRFTIEGKEVTSEEWDRYFDEKVLVRFSTMLNRSETCLNYSAKELWKEDLVKLLSSLEPYDPENPGLNSYAVGLFDLNFDNIPEVLVAYPGGSMGNIWVHIYDLKQPDEPIAYYNGAGFGGDGKTLHLTVAKTGEDYVVLAEGEIRDPEAGWCHMIAKLSNQLPADKRYLSSEAWFVIADKVNTAGNGPYYYMGESVEKAKYDEEYQKFQKEYTVFASTGVKLAYWKHYDLTNREQLVLDMANALLHSEQDFIDYNK